MKKLFSWTETPFFENEKENKKLKVFYIWPHDLDILVNDKEI